jgi:hypothetical protein
MKRSMPAPPLLLKLVHRLVPSAAASDNDDELWLLHLLE